KSDKSAPVALDRADFLPASGASPTAKESPATRRSPHLPRPGSRKGVGKCAGIHEAPEKDYDRRLVPGAKCESSAAPADALNASPEHRALRPRSCPLVANARVAP